MSAKRYGWKCPLLLCRVPRGAAILCARHGFAFAPREKSAPAAAAATELCAEFYNAAACFIKSNGLAYAMRKAAGGAAASFSRTLLGTAIHGYQVANAP